MAIKDPQHKLHPGQILLEVYMQDCGYNQSTLAVKLGCAPRKINEIVNGKRGITPEFALQLAKVFDTTAEMWVHLQGDYDLFVARRKLRRSEASPSARRA